MRDHQHKMGKPWPRQGGLVSFWAAVAMLAALLLTGSPPAPATALAAPEALTPAAFLPVLAQAYRCPATGGASYERGFAFQFDLDNPVRPAELHADKNISLRGYVANDDPAARRDLVDYGLNDPAPPPQFATLFKPARVPHFPAIFQVHEWVWAPSPDPGRRGDLSTHYAATALALATTPGEVLGVPASGYDIGNGQEVLVLYADADTVALRYTREDSSGSGGYTVYVDNICTDPNLLALYRELDRPDGPRYVYVPPKDRPYGYDLPAIPAGKRIGVAGSGYPVIVISDTGGFQDPRSCNDWWQVRPGYGNDCQRD